MTARDEVLASIRRSLNVTGREAPRRATVTERLANAPRGVITARGALEGAERLKLFCEQAEAAAATISSIADHAALPHEVARVLRESNLPASLRIGADPRLAGLDWSATPITITRGASDGRDLNGLSHAFAGIAEIGTLALVSGSHNPTTLNFLPDNHIVVLAAADLERDLESVWARLRAAYRKGEMPRVVNLITGPSRSADIEQTLLLGAHGPRRLHIVIVGVAD
jgi:L-lactate dehydrogenase complex protein LldG